MKKLNIGITGSTGVLGKKLILLNKKKYKFIKFTGDITSKKDVFNWIQQKNLLSKHRKAQSLRKKPLLF